MKKYSKIISFTLVMVMMVTLLTGCGETKKAETTVNNAFAALKELDFEKAADYINLDEIIDSENESEDALALDDTVIMENLFGKLEHKIVSSEKLDKDTVIVKAEITAIDMKPVLAEFIGNALQYAFANAFASPQPSEEEVNQKMIEMFVESISKEDLATVTKEVDMNVVKVDKKWKIEATDELSNALLGGLIEAAKELGDSFSDAN